jgi:hypothetical protein
MEQLVTQRKRTISQTTDLTMPVALAVPSAGAVAPVLTTPVDGVGTFGAWVEQHYAVVGLLGMTMAGVIMMVPSVSVLAVKLGPVLALSSWIAGQGLAKAGRGAEADVAGSLALVALAVTTVAALFGAA